MYANDLSFDPADPRFPVPGAGGVQLAVQVFTVGNVYGLAPESTTVETGEGTLRLVADGLAWAGQQRRAAGRVVVDVASEPGGWSIRVTAEHDEPIKAVKVVLHDLPAAALAEGWWQLTSPAGAPGRRPAPFEPIRWRYPWPEDDPWPEWETPWAAAGQAIDGPAVCLSVRDDRVRPVRLFVSSPPWAGGDPVTEVIVEEEARCWDGRFAAPPVRLALPSDAAALAAEVAAHLDHVEAAHGLARWEERTDVPDWFRQVRLVVTLHGMHWTGHVFQTYDEMLDVLGWLADLVPGEQVMAYLPGWEGRYYHDYPDYAAAPELGGDDGLVALVEEARALGTRVVPMFGVHGANATRYPGWEEAAFLTRRARSIALVNAPDWDGDRAGEDDQIFLNPGEPGFRAHLLEQVSGVVARYGVDGVFLDTSACWFNDPRHDPVAGERALVAALHERHPGLLVAGEGWFDALLGFLPVNQSWLGTDRTFRHPEVLTRWGRALGHLSVGAPGPGSTGVHEGGWYPSTPPVVAPGHVASLGVVRGTIAEHGAEVAALVRAVTAP